MKDIKKQFSVKSILVYVYAAVIGIVSFIGAASFWNYYVIAVFQEYSRFPYASLLSYVSIGVCTIILIVLAYLWMISFLNQNEKKKVLIISIPVLFLGIVIGYPVLTGVTYAVKGYVSLIESKGTDDLIYLFLKRTVGVDWLNLSGLAMVVLLLIPNIRYASKNKGQVNRCTNKFMNIIEQIGRYGCMFFMIIILDFAIYGFGSGWSLAVNICGNIILMTSYWVIWDLYIENSSYRKQMSLAIIPTAMFLLNGVTMGYYLLIIFAVLFGAGHIYVTAKNG